MNVLSLTKRNGNPKGEVFEIRKIQVLSLTKRNGDEREKEWKQEGKRLETEKG